MAFFTYFHLCFLLCLLKRLVKISEKCQISRSQKPSQIKTCGWKKYMSFFTSRKVPERVGSQFLCRRNLWRHFENTLFLPFLAQNGQNKVPSRVQITPPNNFSHQKNIVEDSQAPKYIGKIFFGRTWSDPERLDLLSCSLYISTRFKA